MDESDTESDRILWDPTTRQNPLGIGGTEPVTKPTVEFRYMSHRIQRSIFTGVLKLRCRRGSCKNLWDSIELIASSQCWSSFLSLCPVFWDFQVHCYVFCDFRVFVLFLRSSVSPLPGRIRYTWAATSIVYIYSGVSSLIQSLTSKQVRSKLHKGDPNSLN
jgi:hypothetical protein